MLPIFAAAIILSVALKANACTTFIIGKKGTADGSVLATHSNDGGGTTDPRLTKIPARDFAPNETRPIYGSPENYPRYVGRERNAPIYYPENCEAGEALCKEFPIFGYIPQVPHTFAYFEATYGIINEKQVGLAESTCSGVFTARAVGNGGNALLSIDQLSQIAMERASTAREAAQLMGDLAVKYGFYGESDSFEGGAESLLITDPNEAWVFHILPDNTGASAIWIAQRVPDDSVAVVANMFIIREVNLTDTDNFLGRSDMWEIAEQAGLYKPGDVKDFTRTFSDGEYSHKYYSGRRVWRVMDVLCPSLHLSPEYGSLKYDAPYPFSCAVESPVPVRQAFALMRDFYNNTAFSTGRTEDQLAGGAFNTPDRYSGGDTYSVSGSWERTIAIYRSSDTFVVQSRNIETSPDRVATRDLLGGVLWFGPESALYTVYVPLFLGINSAPESLERVYQGTYNLSTNFWVTRNIATIAQYKFHYMIRDIQETQELLEKQSQQLVDSITNRFLAGEKIDWNEVTKSIEDNTRSHVQAYSQLLNYLLFTYADGDVNYWDNDRFNSASQGYPAWWLKAVGYQRGPPPVSEFSILGEHFQQMKKRRNAEHTEVIAQFSKDHDRAYNMNRSKVIAGSVYVEKELLRNCALNCHQQYREDFEKCFNICL